MSEQADAQTIGAIDQAERALEVLYARLLDTGEKTSAERIYQKCQTLAEQGAARITTAAVGELCEKHNGWGGPKAQSISNKPKTLAALVKAWNTLHQLRHGRFGGLKTQTGKVYVEDPTAAAYVHVLENEVSELRRSNQRLSEAFRNLKPLQFSSTPASELLESTEKVQAGYGRPTQRELEAVRTFLSEGHLGRFGLKYDERGRILDGRQVLVDAAVVGLLVRLVGALDSIADKG